MFFTFYTLFKIRFISLLHYRFTMIMGLFTQMTFGFFIIYTYRVFLSSGQDTDLPLNQKTSYVWVCQALFSLHTISGDPLIKELGVSGQIATDLLKPLALHDLWLVLSIGRLAALVFSRGSVLLLVMTLLGWMKWNSFLSFFLFLLTLPGSIVIAALIQNFLHATLLWFVMPIEIFFVALGGLLSGVYLPLPYYPDFFRKIVELLPLRAIHDIPARVANGIFGFDFLYLLAFQWIWILILYFMCRFIFSRGLKNLVISGG